MNKEQLERVPAMSLDEIEHLPFGAIVIDSDGVILRYNQFEAQFARLDAERVIGKNFFRDVAPCTAVKGFEGHMQEFLSSNERVSVTFDFRFSFKHEVADVAITFMKMEAGDSVLIAVERRGTQTPPSS
jgi:photoactive yellow protein